MINQKIKKRIIRHLNTCEGCWKIITQHMVLNGDLQIEDGKLICKKRK